MPINEISRKILNTSYHDRMIENKLASFIPYDSEDQHSAVMASLVNLKQLDLIDSYTDNDENGFLVVVSKEGLTYVEQHYHLAPTGSAIELSDEARQLIAKINKLVDEYEESKRGSKKFLKALSDLLRAAGSSVVAEVVRHLFLLGL